MNFNYGIDRIATIPSGMSQSQVVDLEFYELMGIHMPDTWDAAEITFLVASHFNGPLLPLHDELGAELTVTADADEAYGFRNQFHSVLSPWRYIAVRSGTSAVPVNQTADRAVVLVGK